MSHKYINIRSTLRKYMFNRLCAIRAAEISERAGLLFRHPRRGPKTRFRGPLPLFLLPPLPSI